ncbi:MAG: 4-hydroxy-3-methylbut-2-enyl diphosphate reductase [Treponema sp.]|nr:4-hydroxy-3-methylbut-2-enyl diphosphate reductase [Treponema sp.]
MTIIRSDVLGYCFGVRHAIEAAHTALLQNKRKNVYTLGPLIHNKHALDELEKAGLRMLDENDASQAEDGSVVIIRAHGVPPEVLETLEKKQCTVINATCTRVKASQKIAREYTAKNCTVIFTGDEKHGEVAGIAGYAKNHFVLVQNCDEANALYLPKDANAVLLSQTTFSESEFNAIAKLLKSKYPNLIVMNTICPATKARQDALAKLCRNADGVLVVGGKNSANTKRLLLAARAYGCRANLIEQADEIPADYFSMDTVGITAGASTPDEIIDEVEKTLRERSAGAYFAGDSNE